MATLSDEHERVQDEVFAMKLSLAQRDIKKVVKKAERSHYLLFMKVRRSKYGPYTAGSSRSLGLTGARFAGGQEWE